MSDKQNHQRPVYVYLAVLFTVAIVLILYSFLMTHRNSQQILRELKDSNNILQTTIQENNDLESRVAELEAELADTQDKLQSALDANAAYEDSRLHMTDSLTALDYLRAIEREYNARQYSAARELVKSFEEAGLAAHLPNDSLYTDPNGHNAVSPSESYAAIVAALFPNGLN